MDSGLATAYYIIGIISMSLITLILIGLIIVAVKVVAKINHIHSIIEERVQPVKDFAKAASHIAKAAKDTFTK
ncbi:MAG: hypothetical protein EOT05_04010 [Candidatus Microsaccharimonas sossegonensis]|uniref:Uncharacterized protein n=1 Tax=Candidatus Microsaccharimonas sossegonensis TaxID=2506948 RepID=A0A4Q0AIH2_9BACT|nr:MAG: hypothetical protein EOT05_04010 [Candidatus Microsaccharimonas sossegonensis]